MVVQFALARIDWRRSPVLVLTALGPSVVYVRDDTCAGYCSGSYQETTRPMGFAGTSHCSRKIRCEYGERSCDHQVVMTARRLQSELASRARLEYELS